jgi:hypothetical protein
MFSGIKRWKLPVYVPVASSFAVSQAVYFNFDAAGTFFVPTFSLKRNSRASHVWVPPFRQLSGVHFMDGCFSLTFSFFRLAADTL